MKKYSLLIVFLITLTGWAQHQKQDTTMVFNPDLFTDQDIALIDSLLLSSKVSSPLLGEANKYIIDDTEIIKVDNSVLTTDLLKERLALIDQTTPFNIAYNPALEKVINSYLKRRRKYYPELMARAAYYFPLFEKHLDQFDVPLEMKYLAIVESALKPKVKSRVGATGLWQFMYQTGRQYDLNVNSYVDERQDPIKSTIAACKFLNRLYTIFGDWDLALAAYNSGPGNVTKAIRRSGGYRNYWNIRPFLPRETAGYVPAFYATMYLFMYAEEHGLVGNEPVIYQFETDTVQVKRTVSFDQITETTGIDTELIRFLNPSYKLDIIPYVKGKNYVLTLPKKYTQAFLSNENALYALADADDAKREKPLARYFEMDNRIRYKVRKGDYLGRIASKFGVRVSDIKRWNSLKSTAIREGQRLTIYPKRLRITKQDNVSTSAVKSTKNPSTKLKVVYYEVRKGDSLWTIAKKYNNVSVAQIKKWNNIWRDNSLKPGTKIKIYKS